MKSHPWIAYNIDNLDRKEDGLVGDDFIDYFYDQLKDKPEQAERILDLVEALSPFITDEVKNHFIETQSANCISPTILLPHKDVAECIIRDLHKGRSSLIDVAILHLSRIPGCNKNPLLEQGVDYYGNYNYMLMMISGIFRIWIRDILKIDLRHKQI